MAGEKNLKVLLHKLTPELNTGEYVFTSVKNANTISRADILCEFKEAEGVTIIIERERADALGLPYDTVTSWITLNIHSSLDAVGLTAAFSVALAKENISCNVVAGYYHDHIFVNQGDAKRALDILRALSPHQTP